jgi:hypothetical protein
MPTPAVKRSIVVIPLGTYYDVCVSIKQNLDLLTGRVGGEITPLPATAQLADVIAKLNAVIARLNGSTN